MEGNVFYINFYTRIYPGKLQAVKITIEVEIIEDMRRLLALNLCDHPLYQELEQYVLGNPSGR